MKKSRERNISRAGIQMGYLFSDAIELGQDIEERHLGNDELLLLILVEWGSRKVQCQVHKGGFHHCLLVLIIMEQLLFFLRWLKMSEKKKEGWGKECEQQETTTDRNNVFTYICFLSY